MQSHDCNIRRNFPDRRDGALEALRLIHDDMCDVMLTLECKRPLPTAFVEPGLVPKLHCEPESFHPPHAFLDVAEVCFIRQKPRRELEEKYPELTRACQWEQRRTKFVPQGIQKLSRQVLVVNRLLIDRQRLGDVLRQHPGRRVMLREQPKSLDVEREVLGGSLYPEFARLFG